MSYLDKLYIKVPVTIYHTLWVIRLRGSLVWLLSSLDSCICFFVLWHCLFTVIFTHVPLKVLLTCRHPHINPYAVYYTGAYTWTTSTAYFQTHIGPSVHQPVAILTFTPVHKLFLRGSQSYPRGLGPTLPQSLYAQHKRQDQVWERQQFFVHSGQLVHSR